MKAKKRQPRRAAPKAPAPWHAAITFERVVAVLGVVVPLAVAVITRPPRPRP